MDTFAGIRTLAATCATTVALTAAQFAGTPVAAGFSPPCPDLYVVGVPGTWETSNADPRSGMLALSADGLPGNTRVDYVPYTATAFPWEGEIYGRSKREATDKARALITDVAAACETTRIAVLGYSQGADAAGDLAAEIGAGTAPVPADRVVLVGLVSDPRRAPQDDLIGPPVPGAGAGGPRPGGFGRLTPRTYTFCAAGDLYCSMPHDDIAGRMAGLAVELSNPDPADLGGYRQQLSQLFADAMAAGGPRLLADLDAAAYEQRRLQINQFLSSGVHQSYPFYPVGPHGTTALTWLRQRLVEATGR